MEKVAIPFPPNLDPEAPSSPYVQTEGSCAHALEAQPALHLGAGFPRHKLHLGIPCGSQKSQSSYSSKWFPNMLGTGSEAREQNSV